MTVEFAAMIAVQRSGTHFLGGAISHHPDLYCASEPFFRRHPETEAECRKIMAECERVHAEHNAKIIVLDIKYNQITPPLEELLRGMPVIHLIRRDIRAIIFSSAFRHYYRNQATRREREDVEQGYYKKITVGKSVIREVTDYIEEMKSRYWYLARLTLYYEDLTDNREVKALPEWASCQICEFFGVPVMELVTGSRKEAPTDYKKYMEVV